MEFVDMKVDNKKHRRHFVLREPYLNHYPEFANFVGSELEGETTVFQADSGRLYEVVVSRETESPPTSLMINLLVDTVSAAPTDNEIDADIWEFLRWLIAGTGGEWKVEELEETGRLFRTPGAVKEGPYYGFSH